MLLSNDLRILLVEDNLVVVDSVLRLLSKLGYNKVESVTDYNAAEIEPRTSNYCRCRAVASRVERRSLIDTS